jgi:hypothetical protein
MCNARAPFIQSVALFRNRGRNGAGESAESVWKKLNVEGDAELRKGIRKFARGWKDEIRKRWRGYR